MEEWLYVLCCECLRLLVVAVNLMFFDILHVVVLVSILVILSGYMFVVVSISCIRYKKEYYMDEVKNLFFDNKRVFAIKIRFKQSKKV